MIKKIVMPPGGQTTDTSTVAKWLVKVGDKVKLGDPLLEVETDKATLTVESFTAGTVLKILVQEGETAETGDPLALVGKPGDLEAEEAKVAPETPEKAPDKLVNEEDEYQPISKKARGKVLDNKVDAKEEGKTKAKGKVKAMPNAKREAKRLNIDLNDVAEHIGGKAVKLADVIEYQRFLEEKAQEEVLEETNEATEVATKPEALEAEFEVVPMSKMRKIIARRMLESVQISPTYNVTVEADMRETIKLRELIKTRNIKVSYNDILMKCMAAAIKKYPLINAQCVNDEIHVFNKVNIGLAVAADKGLVVPVAKDVNNKSLKEIAEVNKANIDKARAGKLELSDMQGGTITLSNLGMYSVEHFTAVINQPELCILAIGGIFTKPVYKDGAWEPVPTMSITATFDHRVIDGAYGAGFLQELKLLLENPSLILL